MPASQTALQDVAFLVLDSNEGMRTVWSALLHGFGARTIHQRASLNDLAEYIRKNKIDILICDYMVEAGSTTEAIAELRQCDDDAVRFIPVIGCTASVSEKVAWDMMSAGFDEVLTKPVSPREAWSKVAAVVERRRAFVAFEGYFGPAYRRAPPGWPQLDPRLLNQNGAPLDPNIAVSPPSLPMQQLLREAARDVDVPVVRADVGAPNQSAPALGADELADLGFDPRWK